MKAYWYDQAGLAADVMQFGELADPLPAKGEVRVKISHSTINPTDVKRRKSGREIGQLGRIIPNNDGAGVIESVGDGVSEQRVGERVWIFGAQAGRPDGTAAEFTVLPSRQAIRLPDIAGLSDGACLGVPAVTAHYGLFSDGSIAGQTVFVSGGSGRVGNCAVQLAKWAGAKVIATAGSAEKIAATKAAGADLVLNYGDEDIVGSVRDFTSGAGVHRIVDTAFSETIKIAPDIVRANGVVASYSSDADINPSIAFERLMFLNISIRPFSIYALPSGVQDRAFGDITTALEAGALKSRIGAEMAFDEMRAAHALMEETSVWGCTVVTLDE